MTEITVNSTRDKPIFIDFVIEVYRLQGSVLQAVTYMYRFIPVGTTYTKFNRDPDFVFRGRLNPGYKLPLDFPVTSYFVNNNTDTGRWHLYSTAYR